MNLTVVNRAQMVGAISVSRALRLLALLVPLAWLLLMAMLADAPNELINVLARVVVVVLVSVAAIVAQRFTLHHTRLWLAFGSAMMLGAWLACAWQSSTLVAWLAVGAWLMWLITLDTLVALMRVRRSARWFARVGIALLGGSVPVVVAQIASQFADEEFFAFVQALALSGFCFLMLSAVQFVIPSRAHSTIKLKRRSVVISLALALGLLSVAVVETISSYQSSFYGNDPPSFAGITPTQTSLCGQVTPSSSTVSGVDVYDQLLRRIETNPFKTPAEFAFIALAKRDANDAQDFRRALLLEAQQQAFTQPMGSVKWGQFEAALRVYYFAKMRAQYPDLFSASEQQSLAQWFAAINRRALTPEWVDALYGIAFREWPLGPYENQENGAGLLAVLEANQLADPNLSERNRAYLQNDPRGWAARFHNTDDSYFYQTHWLNNALFQAQLAPQSVSLQNQRASFEWLLMLTPPDGSPLPFNSDQDGWSANAFYLGAQLLHDPRYVWLASQSLARMSERDALLFAQPGVESALNLQGVAPTTGSCLVYADSGLPTQRGPLAPDKIVLRDGWTDDANYALLNLRFTGWHRYKATNDIITLMRAGPLVVEQVAPERITWLPKGRAALRDKRVPRENLNGLLIPTSGLGGVFALLGIGSGWAQDPPHYARVTKFDPNDTPQIAQSVIEQWHGWTQTRTMYLYPQGPIVIVDSADGGEGRAALSWHVVGDGERDGDVLWLRRGAHPARFVLPHDAWNTTSVRAAPSVYGNAQTIVYYAPSAGRLQLVSVFLTDEWADAQVQIASNAAQRTFRLRISSAYQTIELQGQSSP